MWKLFGFMESCFYISAPFGSCHSICFPNRCHDSLLCSHQLCRVQLSYLSPWSIWIECIRVVRWGSNTTLLFINKLYYKKKPANEKKKRSFFFFKKTNQPGSREKAQWVRMQCRLEDLSLNPPSPSKRPRCTPCTCNLSPVGGRDKRMAGACWLSGWLQVPLEAFSERAIEQTLMSSASMCTSMLRSLMLRSPMLRLQTCTTMLRGSVSL